MRTILILTVAILTLASTARATLDEQLKEEAALRAEIAECRNTLNKIAQLQVKALDEGYATPEGYKYSKGFETEFQKKLKNAERKLQGVQAKITRSRTDLAEKAQKEADAKKKQETADRARAEKAAKDAEERRVAAEKAAAEKRSADAQKAMDLHNARTQEANRVAKATKEPGPTRNTTPPPANVDALKAHEKKREEEAVKAGQARTGALERFAKNPTSQNRAAYEEALKNMNTKVAELNKARHQTDKVSGESRADANVKSTNEVIERLKSGGKLTTAQIDAMRDTIRDTARSASRDQGRDSVVSAARDASRTASVSASKDSAKEANKNMSKTASQSAASSAAKPSGHSYPKPY